MVTYLEKQMKYLRERNLAIAKDRTPPEPPENRLVKYYKHRLECYLRLREGREG
jgi:hypothetical protein